ncbi:MAG: type II toxin-antitoxin system ParD family antitoxin [Burkholderiales bacterium]|nr:type II toxin-antitoxin system ParD family antitoxin [Burkholderiales bacterium]
MSLNISLPIEFEKRVREHVQSGMYGSASEVVREALRIHEVWLGNRIERLQSLKAEIKIGLDDLNAGRFTRFDAEEIKQAARKATKKRCVVVKYFRTLR